MIHSAIFPSSLSVTDGGEHSSYPVVVALEEDPAGFPIATLNLTYEQARQLWDELGAALQSAELLPDSWYEKVTDLAKALEAEKAAHAEKCAELEKMRTLADYRQDKLERREGKDRRLNEGLGRRSGYERRKS
jgi:hypothetical protein